MDAMSDVTKLLDAVGRGDPRATDELLPLVYRELRALAARKLAQEKPGQTLQATALVHEAYLRLVCDRSPAPGAARSGSGEQNWNSRGHFFAAAAEAMRRILVENARRRTRKKHGGELKRVDLSPAQLADSADDEELLSLDEALERLNSHDAQSAELVKLRYFAGLTIPEAAEILGVSPRTADFLWSFARAWLRREIEAE
jgi:RNA polymerase sigma factor (TIGR02999 family)